MTLIKSCRLGPAGNLPLGKQMPLTANALNVQVHSRHDAGTGGSVAAAQRKKKVNDAVFEEALKSPCR